MRKLRMLIASFVVFAIVVSAFAFNTKKIWTYCTSGTLASTTCNHVTVIPTKRGTGANNAYYIPCWEGGACNSTCTVSANFVQD